VLHRITRSWYTGRWRVGCYIWYSKEGPRQTAAPPSPLLAVPNVTGHSSTTSVSITVLLYSGPLLCGFNVASIKALKDRRAYCIIYYNVNEYIRCVCFVPWLSHHTNMAAYWYLRVLFGVYTYSYRFGVSAWVGESGCPPEIIGSQPVNSWIVPVAFSRGGVRWCDRPPPPSSDREFLDNFALFL